MIMMWSPFQGPKLLRDNQDGSRAATCPGCAASPIDRGMNRKGVCIEPLLDTKSGFGFLPNGSDPLKLRPSPPLSPVGARFERMRRLHARLLGGAFAHRRSGRVQEVHR